MKSSKPIISLHHVSLGYGQHRPLLVQNLNLSISQQQLIALVGPNGAGKSTLLRTIAGMQQPQTGKIILLDESSNSLRAKDRARLLSVVLTGRNEISYMKTAELVALGRYPHTSWLGTFTSVDRAKVQSAIDLTGINPLLEKPLFQLSDGERQKVMIARALAQDTPIMILDEPTTHLDITNRMTIVQLLRELVRTENKTIIFSSHDIELALQVADRLWVMHDQTVTAGVPEDLVINGLLTNALGNDRHLFDPASGTFRIKQSSYRPISLLGSGTNAVWTQRALERSGYQIIPDCPLKVKVSSDNSWSVISEGQPRISTNSIHDLLVQLSQSTSATTFSQPDS